MKLLYGKKNRIIITALVLLATVFVSAVVSFSSETELDYVKSQVELLYDELLVQDDRLINSDTYFVTSEYISRIKPNTSIEEFTNSLNRKGFTLFEGGKEVSTGIVKTGMELVRGDEHYTLVVAGDLNKDGLMNYVDTSMMINNTKTLSDNQLIRLANDFNEDSKYDKTDVLNSVDYILDEKIELKEVNKVKTPVIDFVSGDVGDRDWYLGDIKLKLTATEDAEIGYKIIGSVDEMGVVEDGYEITLSGYGAYKVIAWHVGKDGNRSDTTSLVYKIDDREIIPTITYSSTTPGSERVIAAISFNKENVFITNNNGRYTHTFYGNGEFDFEFKDLTGRTGNAKAEVSWVTDSIGEDGLWRYSVLNDEEIYLREYLGEINYGTALVLPAEYDGYKVYGVGNNVTNASISTYGFTSLVIEDGIEELGDYVFFGNDSFSGGLTIPDSIKTIGDNAFAYNFFDGNLKIGKNVEYIGNHAFSNNNFSGDLNIPNKVKIIGNYSFVNSGYYATLTLGEELETIGSGAFNGSRFGGDLVIPEKIEEIEAWAFAYNDFDGQLKLNNNLVSIGESAFETNNFSNNGLVIPDSVTNIGSNAFNSSGIEGNLVISKNIEVISNHAFANNGFTGDLIIPDSVVVIGHSAFLGNGFNGRLVLGSKVNDIMDFAFFGNPFTGDLVLPDSLETIGGTSFTGTTFDGDLVIGDGITDLNMIKNISGLDLSKFKGNLVIGDGVTEIPAETFMNSGFTGTLTLGNNIKTVGSGAFIFNQFKGELKIPNSVKTIGDSAFSHISGFTKLDLGSGVETIGWAAFLNSAFVEDLVIPDSVKEIGPEAFLNSGFTGSLVIGDGVYSIESNSFSSNMFTGDLIIGDKVTDLNMLTYSGLNISDFSGDLSIGDSITEIPDEFFRGVGFTGTLTLGENVKSINFLAFYENEFTGKLIIPDSVETIGTFAFAQNKFTGDLILGKNVRTIDEGAFYQIVDLTGTVDASKIESLHDFAFEGTQVNIINK